MIFCLPTTNPVTSQTVNYTIVAVGIIAIGACGAWVLWARKWFVGPMVELEAAARLGIDPEEPGALERAELNGKVDLHGGVKRSDEKNFVGAEEGL